MTSFWPQNRVTVSENYESQQRNCCFQNMPLIKNRINYYSKILGDHPYNFWYLDKQKYFFRLRAVFNLKFSVCCVNSLKEQVHYKLTKFGSIFHYIPYLHQYNSFLIINCSWISTAHSRTKHLRMFLFST